MVGAKGGGERLGCFNTSAFIGWVIGVSVVLVFLIIAVFVIMVQLRRG